MKKLVSIFAVGLFLTGIAAGGALAGSVGSNLPNAQGVIQAYNSEFTIASESLGGPYQVPMTGDPTPNGNPYNGDNGIRYVPTVGLNAGDVLTFTFTNAKYIGADAVLVAEENAAKQPALTGPDPLQTDFNDNGNTNDVVEVATNVGSTNTTDGVQYVQMRVNSGLRLPANMTLTLVTKRNPAVTMPPNGTLAGKADFPVFKVNANLAPGTFIGVQVTAKNVNQSDINVAAASNYIMDIDKYFELKILYAANSVIDVDAAAGIRKSFIKSTFLWFNVLQRNEDTDRYASSATFGLDRREGSVEDKISCNKIAQLDLTLKPSSGFELEDFTNSRVFVDWTNGQDGQMGTIPGNSPKLFVKSTDGTQATATIPGASFGPGSVWDDIYIGVDTNTGVLSPKTFDLSGALTFITTAPGVTFIPSNFAAQRSHTWTINGAVLTVPHFSTSGLAQSSMVITNTSVSPAQIYIMSAWTNDGTGRVADSIYITDIAPNSTKIVYYSELKKALDTVYGKFSKGMLQILVTAPEDTITASAVLKNSTTGALSTVPVLRYRDYSLRE